MHLAFSTSSPGMRGAPGAFFCLLRTEQTWMGWGLPIFLPGTPHWVPWEFLDVTGHQAPCSHKPQVSEDTCQRSPRLPHSTPYCWASRRSPRACLYCSSLVTAPGGAGRPAAMQASRWERRGQTLLLEGACSPYKWFLWHSLPPSKEKERGLCFSPQPSPQSCMSDSLLDW